MGMPRTLLLHNARIYTLNPFQPQASALALRDGCILALGEQPDLSKLYPGAEMYDMQGGVVIPGLTDAHIHLEYYALSLQRVDCETDSLQACLQRVAQRAAQAPPGAWILGGGWNQNRWEGGYGGAAHLDRVVPHHPVYLTAKSLHAGWANTLALRLAGIDAQTPDPPDGRIGRHENGEPNGLLFEGAMRLVEAAIPETTEAMLVEALNEAQRALWRVGITSVHDFDRRKCFAALQRLHSQGRLKLRVLKSIPLEDLPHAVALGLHSGFGDDILRLGQVKIFADGAVGLRTAAMFQPYVGEEENRGILFMDAEELEEQGRLAVGHGLGLAVHAIGDRAIHEVLDALEGLKEETRTQVQQSLFLRHRIEHVQVIHPQDAHRLGELGIIASMQPIHATSDMSMTERYLPDRAAYAYAWRTQLQHGAILAFGSDAPVESPNPFWGIHAAVTRRRHDGAPDPQGWHAEQCLTVEEALRGFTQGPAYAAGMEDRLGMLKPGYLADLLWLETDPFTCPVDEIKDILPRGTMVGGEWVFLRG